MTTYNGGNVPAEPLKQRQVQRAGEGEAVRFDDETAGAKGFET